MPRTWEQYSSEDSLFHASGELLDEFPAFYLSHLVFEDTLTPPPFHHLISLFSGEGGRHARTFSGCLLLPKRNFTKSTCRFVCRSYPEPVAFGIEAAQLETILWLPTRRTAGGEARKYAKAYFCDSPHPGGCEPRNDCRCSRNFSDTSWL